MNENQKHLEDVERRVLFFSFITICFYIYAPMHVCHIISFWMGSECTDAGFDDNYSHKLHHYSKYNWFLFKPKNLWSNLRIDIGRTTKLRFSS